MVKGNGDYPENKIWSVLIPGGWMNGKYHVRRVFAMGCGRKNCQFSL